MTQLTRCLGNTLITRGMYARMEVPVPNMYHQVRSVLQPIKADNPHVGTEQTIEQCKFQVPEDATKETPLFDELYFAGDKDHWIL